VLFASLVDDPSSRQEEFPTAEAQEAERQRLFRIIEELVKWENSNNEHVLGQARAEIMKATGGNPPPVLDPFCGGGSIPLEAQRLGLEAHASDLNPVAVLVTKALIEIPPKFADRAPVNLEARQKLAHGAAWKGARGLSADVRYYGNWMRDEALTRIGHLYPKAKLASGGEATVIAWIWARTARCPNPACAVEMPLVRSFVLSTKKGKEWHAQPNINGGSVTFEVRQGKDAPEGTIGRRGGRCVVCGTAVPFDHLRAEGSARRMGARLMAIIAAGERKRLYLPPETEHEQLAVAVDSPADPPTTDLPVQALGFRVQRYGMTKHRDLFTTRQLMALTTFSDLVSEARAQIREDSGDDAYADAIATYLALIVDRGADYWSSICSWHSGRDLIRNTFARQAIPMVWDFAEANPFSHSAGSFEGSIAWTASALEAVPASSFAITQQLDATTAIDSALRPIICTDPPYYDNVPYADLSDFFYVWLRRPLSPIYGDLFSTLLTPKADELIAEPARFGGNSPAARAFFERGMAQFFERAREGADSRYPTTVFYAFKQVESEDGATASTGWETMLSGLVSAGFAITGTWPMRSELGNRMRNLDSNALASSIMLVCRPRSGDASIATHREFVNSLRRELPEPMRTLQHGNIAPVDLAQAAIGPGMAIFSRYAKVVVADGSAMTVRTALGLINHALDEILTEQEGDFDPYTRFAVSWFREYGFGEGEYGRAETLATARAVSVDGVVRAGILHSRASKVRLLKRDELDPSWNPSLDTRPTVWEAAHHLVQRLDQGGESSAAELLQRLGGYGETARELAHVLYSVCDRKGWAQEALDYNALGTAWRDIAQLASQQAGAEQQTLGV
jgi:putative DNA methylase